MDNKIISLNEAINEIESIVDTMSVCVSTDECKGMRRMKKSVLERISALSPVDVVPVVHGEWREAAYGFWQCTACCFTSESRYKFCPHCGALMDGKDGDGNA